jgi:hypothetical protein
MDMIGALQALLGPLLERSGFVLDDADPIGVGTVRRLGLLEYHRTLDDGEMVLFGLYQLPAQRMIVAEMWAPDDLIRMVPDPSAESVARHRLAWSYDEDTDADVLVRTIVTEVMTWLGPFGPTIQPDSEAPPTGT